MSQEELEKKIEEKQTEIDELKKSLDDYQRSVKQLSSRNDELENLVFFWKDELGIDLERVTTVADQLEIKQRLSDLYG